MTPTAIRFGAIGGVIAIVTTLGANLSILFERPADLCRIGPIAAILFNVGALVVFLFLAGAVGLATGRAEGSVAQATLAGVVLGVVAGAALLLIIPFIPALTNRLQEVNALCPVAASFGGSGSFAFGSTPPPGVALPTPPPGFFTTPPPLGSAAPPTGVAGAVATAIGFLVTIAVGTGLAAGAAALAGLIGAATRRQ